MNITIDINDYLSAEEIKSIASEAVYEAFYYQAGKFDLEQFISNLGYEFVFAIVAKQFNTDADRLEKMICNKVTQLLSEDSTIRYELFRRKDAWDRSESPAVSIMDDVARNSRPLIEAAVEKRIENYPFPELHEEIGDTIYECIMRRLCGESNDV